MTLQEEQAGQIAALFKNTYSRHDVDYQVRAETMVIYGSQKMAFLFWMSHKYDIRPNWTGEGAMGYNIPKMHHQMKLINEARAQGWLKAVLS